MAVLGNTVSFNSLANGSTSFDTANVTDPPRGLRRGIGSAKGPLAREDTAETSAAKRLVKVTRRIGRVRDRYETRLENALERARVRITSRINAKRDDKLAELKAQRADILAELAAE